MSFYSTYFTGEYRGYVAMVLTKALVLFSIFHYMPRMWQCQLSRTIRMLINIYANTSSIESAVTSLSSVKHFGWTNKYVTQCPISIPWQSHNNKNKCDKMVHKWPNQFTYNENIPAYRVGNHFLHSMTFLLFRVTDPKPEASVYA